jgi:AraC family transcriptional regulator of adaptative response/methylated-DNA-[protein]-cysteine methyltransferase
MFDGPADLSTYRRIEAAIHYLQRHAQRQPSLAQVAAAVGVSESSLQRSFSAFAGVSPKRFLQYLTKEHARQLLFDSRDVLSATLESGLSSAGRLHDLMIAAEALTPGEIGRRGAGVVLETAMAETPLGQALAAFSPRGLSFLGFIDDEQGGAPAARADLRARWPHAELRDTPAAAARLSQVFADWRAQRPLHLVLAGTNFQLKVWEALLAIPSGHLVTYGQLARAMGAPAATRAVASAIGRNPVSVLIPCHRVIRESGDLGGYHWGLPRKAAILALEAGQREARGLDVRAT